MLYKSVIMEMVMTNIPDIAEVVIASLTANKDISRSLLEIVSSTL